MTEREYRDKREDDKYNNADRDPEKEYFGDDASQEERDYGNDTPIAQGDASITDVPEDINPGDELIMIDENSGEMIDLSDVEEMEEYASIANTGGEASLVVDSDVEDHTSNPNDEDVLADYNDRMQTVGGSERLMDDLAEYRGQSPKISGNDVDAAWIYSDQAGEEGVGGSVPTPDQDVVEELGEAVGIEYNDYEPLNTEEKLNARDENRWELNPESQDDDDTSRDENDTGAELPPRPAEDFGTGMEDEEL